MNNIPLFLYYKELVANHVDSQYREFVFVEPPKESIFGDFSTNIAMVLAGKINCDAMALAEDICTKLQKDSRFERIEVKKPGFINWFIPRSVFFDHIPSMLDKDFGKSDYGNGKLINVEYVSANPTGPIHTGHVRGAVSGDVLVRLLDFVGYKVTKEYYINDAGKQVEILARSLYYRYLEQLKQLDEDFPCNGYPGEYLIDTAKKIVSEHGDKFVHAKESQWLDFFRQFAVSDMMAGIKKDLDLLGVHHDVFVSESELIKSGAVDHVIDWLKDQGLVYTGILPQPKGGGDSEDWEEREQLLFKSTAFGDDMDRPIRKSDGSWTYFASDVAYHMNKIERGFDEMVDFWGADHGGYVKRMQAAVLAISDGKMKLDVKLVQLVRLLENGHEAKMSKRAGTFVTARDIVNKVGKDVVRFIMLTRRDDVSLDFDFQKVVDQSRDNPVFYVQYAYARSCSVMKLFHRIFPDKIIPDVRDVNLELLDNADLNLIKIISDWPRQVIMAAKKREPHKIAFFLLELAAAFHSFWNQGKDNSLLRFVIPDDFEKTCVRLILLKIMQNVIESTFNIMGVTPVKELR
ncbi:MAG: arginine--tRNA ligase [Holosporaceae bacterium]|jgi:arginyl-tRNA synthetase|nr:arginine--tRNA ligase [Holosporaceae bacterium]